MVKLSKAQEDAARKRRAARTAAVKGGAKKVAAPHQQLEANKLPNLLRPQGLAGRVKPAAKALVKSGAKASKAATPAGKKARAEKIRKANIGRDAGVGTRPKTKREIKKARRTT